MKLVERAVLTLEAKEFRQTDKGNCGFQRKAVDAAQKIDSDEDKPGASLERAEDVRDDGVESIAFLSTGKGPASECGECRGHGVGTLFTCPPVRVHPGEKAVLAVD